MTPDHPQSQSLLLVLPLQAHRSDSRIFVDGQAHNGLRLWLENFDNLILACPTFDGPAAYDYLPVDDSRIGLVALPPAYTPLRFATALYRTLPLLRGAIIASEHLHFAIGGVWGDWGAVSCLLAVAMKRPYAVWTDRVESEVIRFQLRSQPWPKRIYSLVNVRLTQWLERFVIRHAALGLFHGMDCYAAYAKYSKSPHLVDDIHIGEDAHIAGHELARRLVSNDPFHFVYAGRVHRDKGVFDWIEVVSQLAQQRRDFRATWFGDGPELDEARSMVLKKSLGGIINFPGAVSHTEIMQRLKVADAFVFCHKTPESPRCLIEALACGLPLIGYHSDYASHLVAQNKGGCFSPQDDTRALASTVAGLFDKAILRDLSERAARDGARFTSDAVFKHRSDLMKRLGRSHSDVAS